MLENLPVTKLVARNYKNLSIADGVNLRGLNVLIGPNGSGKSNLINLLKFLRGATTAQINSVRNVTSFEDSLLILGRMLDATVEAPAQVGFEFYFFQHDVFELNLLVNPPARLIAIMHEALREADKKNGKDYFYYYLGHSRKHGTGVVSVGPSNDPSKMQYEQLDNIPGNELMLAIMPHLLEKSKSPPGATPIYQARNYLFNQIGQWQFYNANHMNLRAIREAEPKLGLSDRSLSESGENLALVLHNLMQGDLDFEEDLNLALKEILPQTRKFRTNTSRLTVSVQWHYENIKEPFFLDEMSDGTVMMLCWAAVLLAPALPTLLVIEEPEVGLHPSWMRILASWIRRAAQTRQIIVSTHSPELLDHLTETFVQGEAQVLVANRTDLLHFGFKPLALEQVKSQLEAGWQLGDLYRVGDPSIQGWPW